jgi:hypothetical protein
LLSAIACGLSEEHAADSLRTSGAAQEDRQGSDAEKVKPIPYGLHHGSGGPAHYWQLTRPTHYRLRDNRMSQNIPNARRLALFLGIPQIPFYLGLNDPWRRGVGSVWLLIEVGTGQVRYILAAERAARQDVVSCPEQVRNKEGP